MPAADADLARAVHEVADAGRGALPQLGQRGQVGLVVGADLQRGGPSMRSRSSSTTGTSIQCRFGATSSAPRSMSTRPGTATVAPIGRRPCAWTSFSAPCVERAERVEDLLDAAAAVVDRLHPLVARAAGEVGGLDADVVDVDLQPERDHAVARDVDHQARPPGGAAVLGAALDEQPEVHQLADQAGHRALVQARVPGRWSRVTAGPVPPPGAARCSGCVAGRPAGSTARLPAWESTSVT